MGAVNGLHAGSHLLLFCFISLPSTAQDMRSDKWSHLGQQITILLLQAGNLALSLLLVVSHLQDQLLQRLILCLTQNKQSLTQSIIQSINHSIHPSITSSVLKFGTLQPKAATIRHKYVGNAGDVSLGKDYCATMGRKHEHSPAGQHSDQTN